MKITDFLVMDSNGNNVQADAHGNIIAFACCTCSHPVLAIAQVNQRGSDEAHPSACKGCGQNHFLDVRNHASKLYIHQL
ncbi:hypothetical protein R50072_01340 [Simiduia litorea]